MESEPQQPPHDARAEQTILGAALMSDEAATVMATVSPEDFHIPRLAEIARAMQAVQQAGDPLDVLLVGRELERRGKLQAVGGWTALSELSDSVGTTVHVARHAATIRELAQQRRLLRTLQRLVADGFGGKVAPRAYLEQALREVLDATHVREASEPQRLDAILHEEWSVMERQQTAPEGYRTGLRDLDAILLPLEAKQLILIAARPSAGKTSLVLHLVAEIARRGGNALFFSLETTAGKLARRALAQQTGVPAAHLATAKLAPEEWDQILVGAQALQGLPVWIDDGYDLTGPRLRAKCRRMVAQHGPLGVIVVDYLQLLESTQRGESREREIAEISRGLKRLAKEFACPVIALSQLNRDSEKRSDKAPSLADLRGSGQLEQDADVVLLLQRTGESETTVTVAKQKDGPTGECKLRFHAETMRFADQDNVVSLWDGMQDARARAAGDDDDDHRF